MYKRKERKREFKRPSDLSKRINAIHNGTKKYYDKWIHQEN